MIKPNFLIIGSPKSGTTSLYYYLKQHPEIGFSVRKEPKYFCWRDLDLNFNGNLRVLKQIRESTIQDEEAYRSLFTGIKSRFVGEASVDYFHTLGTAERIAAFNPDMKLIVLMRNPVERAFSDWRHNLKMGYETEKEFSRALDLVNFRKSNRGVPYFNYLVKGNYYTHLMNYLEFFPSKNILLLLFDDFKDDPNLVCNDIIRFLGTKRKFKFNTNKIYTKSNYIPYSYKVHKLFKKLKFEKSYLGSNLFKLNSINPNMKTRDRKFLQLYYEKEIMRMEEFLRRDLSNWRS